MEAFGHGLLWHATKPHYTQLAMDDGRRFNILDVEGRLMCPACGLPAAFLYPAYDERGGIPGSGICSCCFWEPGFDDIRVEPDATALSTLDCLRLYRRGWSSFGPAWQGRANEIPPGWNGKAQLERLFALAPWVV
jgi:hypothetical protein